MELCLLVGLCKFSSGSHLTYHLTKANVAKLLNFKYTLSHHTEVSAFLSFCKRLLELKSSFDLLFFHKLRLVAYLRLKTGTWFSLLLSEHLNVFISSHYMPILTGFHTDPIKSYSTKCSSRMCLIRYPQLDELQIPDRSFPYPYCYFMLLFRDQHFTAPVQAVPSHSCQT